ncbi:MAG: hypothetical protein WCV84_04345 [Patescibacteria group bacterium]
MHKTFAALAYLIVVSLGGALFELLLRPLQVNHLTTAWILTVASAIPPLAFAADLIASIFSDTNHRTHAISLGIGSALSIATYLLGTLHGTPLGFVGVIAALLLIVNVGLGIANVTKLVRP